jgi:hypothetical protein
LNPLRSRVLRAVSAEAVPLAAVALSKTLRTAEPQNLPCSTEIAD